MKNTMLLFSATMHYNATVSNRYIAEIYLALYVKKVNTYFFRNILKNQAFHDTDIYLLQNTFSVKSMPIALIGRLSTNSSSTFFHYCCYHHQHLLSSVFLWHILLSTCFSPLLKLTFWEVDSLIILKLTKYIWNYDLFSWILKLPFALSLNCWKICTHQHLTK